jgi:hypothetical protein
MRESVRNEIERAVRHAADLAREEPASWPLLPPYHGSIVLASQSTYRTIYEHLSGRKSRRFNFGANLDFSEEARSLSIGVTRDNVIFERGRGVPAPTSSGEGDGIVVKLRVAAVFDKWTAGETFYFAVEVGDWKGSVQVRLERSGKPGEPPCEFSPIVGWWESGGDGRGNRIPPGSGEQLKRLEAELVARARDQQRANREEVKT